LLLVFGETQGLVGVSAEKLPG